MDDKFSIINKTKGKIPNLPFVDLKNNILGKNYCLSVALLSKEKIRIINRTYRSKDKPTNILSFILSKNEGEILLCPSLIKTETKKFNMNFKNLLKFLMIHGMLHLKGFEHGTKMEQQEKRYLSSTKF